MTEIKPNPHRSTIFTTPLWGYEFLEHEKEKNNFVKTIDSCEEKNYLLPNELSSRSKKTGATLHQNPVFKPLTDQLLAISAHLKQDFFLEESVHLGITCMHAMKTDPGGVQAIPESLHSLVQGFYFLDTPENSGMLHIHNPSRELSYFDFLCTQMSTFNQKLYQTLMPEGIIILMPSHLKVDITVNKSDQVRRILHFNICTL